jgi:hypothetical protein
MLRQQSPHANTKQKDSKKRTDGQRRLQVGHFGLLVHELRVEVLAAALVLVELHGLRCG